MITRPGGFNGRVERQQVGLFGNRTDSANDLVDAAAAGLQLDHGFGRLGQAAAEPVDVVRGHFDLLLALGHAAMAVLGGLRCAAARPRHFIGGGHHFIECRGHQFDRFPLAPGGFVHVVRHFAVDP